MSSVPRSRRRDAATRQLLAPPNASIRLAVKVRRANPAMIPPSLPPPSNCRPQTSNALLPARHKETFMKRKLLLSLGSILLGGCLSAAAADWPQWGGTPGRNMVSDEKGSPTVCNRPAKRTRRAKNRSAGPMSSGWRNSARGPTAPRPSPEERSSWGPTIPFPATARATGPAILPAGEWCASTSKRASSCGTWPCPGCRNAGPPIPTTATASVRRPRSRAIASTW